MPLQLSAQNFIQDFATFTTGRRWSLVGCLCPERYGDAGLRRCLIAVDRHRFHGRYWGHLAGHAWLFGGARV